MAKPFITYETGIYLYIVSVKMVRCKISLLTVVKGNTLFGIVTIRDIIKYFYEKIKISIIFPKRWYDMVSNGKNNIINIVIPNFF